jgi:hypothetical protein
MRLKTIIYLLLIMALSIIMLSNEAFCIEGMSYEFIFSKPSINYKKSITSLSYNANTIAVGSIDGNVKLYEFESKKEIKAIIRNSHPVTSITFSPNGNIIAVGLESGDIILWDANYKERIKTFKGHKSRVNSIKFNKDGSFLVSASDDRLIKIWDMKSGGELRTLSGHTDAVNSIDISEDGKIVVSGSKDGYVKTWDTSSGNRLLNINADSASINSVSISLDGVMIVSGSTSGLIKIWDVNSGEEKITLPSQKASITTDKGLQFSPDSNILASGQQNGSIVIWDLSSGVIISELKQHKGKINAILITSDGKNLLSTGDDGNINFWRIRVTEILNIALKADYDNWQRGILSLEADVVGNPKEVVFQYTEDGNTWNDIFIDTEPPYSVDWDTRGLLSGVIANIRLRATTQKASGMSAMSISEKGFSIDNQAPITSLDYDGLWHRSDFTINLSATDGNGSGLTDTFYRLNYGNRKNIKIDGQPKITTQGINTLEYWSVDRLGNEEEHKIIADIKLDKLPPVFSNWAKEPQIISKDYKGAFRISLSVIDQNGSGLYGKIPQIKYKIGATSSYSNYTDMTQADDLWYFDIPEPSGGWIEKFNEPLYYMVRCEDFAGNTGESVEQQEIIGSAKIPPTVKLTSKFKKWEGGKITLSAEPNDLDGIISEVKFSYSLDGIKWIEIAKKTESPYTIEWDTKGVVSEIANDVRIQVNATDNDNLTARDLSDAFGLDNQPPNTTHDQDGKWRKSDFNVTLKADDGDGSGISRTMYKINDGYERQLDRDGQPRIDEQGENTLEYWSIDVVGNEEKPKSISGLKLDRFPPSIENWKIKKEGKTVIVSVNIADSQSGIDSAPEFDYHISPTTQFTGYKSMTKGDNETWIYKITITEDDIGKMLYCKVTASDSAGNLTIKSWETTITDEIPAVSQTDTEAKYSSTMSSIMPDNTEGEIVSKKESTGESSKIEWIEVPPKNIKPETRVNYRGRIVAKLTSPEQVELMLTAPDDLVYVANTYTNMDGEFSFNAPIISEGEWSLVAIWKGNSKYQSVMSEPVVINAGLEEIKIKSEKKKLDIFNKKTIIIGVLALYLLVIGLSR